ncbi:hypothetical protein CDAR_548491 [Caerostris darwini]|uniref:Uncharacterized protein n=1 Tax=Caerostris darwini TaxID=1538125 RepID=A0AAV4WKB6_9ARAC|nr:hypothetical protein CDAR_548491 [Caerostris darwini]
MRIQGYFIVLTEGCGEAQRSCDRMCVECDNTSCSRVYKIQQWIQTPHLIFTCRRVSLFSDLYINCQSRYWSLSFCPHGIGPHCHRDWSTAVRN